jgi:hypothetical protein
MNRVTHMLELTNIWKTISTKKVEPADRDDRRSTCRFFKKYVLGYEDLTHTKQEHARTLPKGIYVENIMIQILIL